MESKPTFGEWLRWVIARLGIERAELAKLLGASTTTITNLYRRETPDGVSDVFLSRLAQLLGMTEPELMTKWREGLPPLKAPAPPRAAKPLLPHEKRARSR